jgi:hypothetical protein
MPETFHPFARLPYQLREKIWKLAIRPDIPSVHYFNVGLFTGDRRKEPTAHTVMCVGREELLYDRLAVPSEGIVASPSNAGTSLGSERKSTYLLDGALWTACKESRDVIDRTFQLAKWNRATKSPECKEGACWSRWLGREEEDKIPANAYFEEPGAKRFWFTFLPSQDLICLLPEDSKTFQYLDWGFCDILLGSHLAGFDGLRNVALEYDPAWGAALAQEQQKPGYCWNAEFSQPAAVKLLANILFDTYSIYNLWIIDYNLKNKPGSAVRTTFYGPNRKLVQYDGIGGISDTNNCLNFVEAVWDLMKEWERISDNSGDGGQKRYADLDILTVEDL